jgi:hypothetical protein
MGDSLECKQAMLMAPIMPNGDVESVLSELSSQVVWDELLREIESHEMPPILHVHDSLQRN